MRRLRAPEFWNRTGPIAWALSPLAAIYGAVAARRMRGEGALVSVPTICIGNLVVGGAGKTPTALAIATICRQLGLRPGFLTRGYGGRARGPVLVALPQHLAGEVGDEALLLAEHAPTVVSADRPAGARLLASLGASVIIMDDGFQNPSLAKDLSLIVVDGSRGIGNGFVLPAGPLRAPLMEQIRRASAVIVVGEGTGGWATRAAGRAGLPVLRAVLEPTRRKGLKGRRYLAFAGIGDPQKFASSLAAAGAQIGALVPFPDHHDFTDAECDALLGRADREGLTPITTEKDRARLAGREGAARRLLLASEVLPVRTRFAEPRRLVALIEDAITSHRSAYRRAQRYQDKRAVTTLEPTPQIVARGAGLPARV